MKFSERTPSLTDLYHLKEQVELDKGIPLDELRQRDRVIGGDCTLQDDAGRLLFWLRKTLDSSDQPDSHGISEGSATTILRVAALVLGFLGMAGFLLGSDKQVPISAFFILFVVLQFILSILSVYVIYRSVKDSPPPIFPLNPTKLLFSRILPDKRFYQECQSVIRILAIRYGQEMGVTFTLGAMLAFFIVLANSGFGFVWSSTFDAINTQFYDFITGFVSKPWASTVSSAVVDFETIRISEDPSEAALKATRQWWPFLIMSMAVYALFPRLCIWAATKIIYGREIRDAFIRYPGSEFILDRMNSPLVTTKDDTAKAHRSDFDITEQVDEGVIMVDWAGTMDFVNGDRFDELANVSPNRTIVAGRSTLEEDLASSKRIVEEKPDRVKVLVKSWEPPMADLRDFMANLTGVKRCTLYLLPLKNKRVAEAAREDWLLFARSLAIDVVDVVALERPMAALVDDGVPQ